MHQDQRIGLALGVLLVGACAALFFRNDNRVTHQPPRLERAKELDDRIAERSTRPYLKGIEVVEAADRKRAASESPVPLNWWNSIDPLNTRRSTEVAKSQVPKSETSGESATASAPETSALVASSEAAPVVVEELTADHADPQTDPAPSAERTHVVQKGETLTSIAAKTLGNPNRFPEIFEANQDQLTDPNDVKLGMTLRIPSSDANEAAKPTVARSQASPSNDSTSATWSADGQSRDPAIRTEMISSLPKESARNGDPTLRTPEMDREESVGDGHDGTQRRFTPSRRLPLPGRVAEPKPEAPKTSSGRRLSQLLPDDVNGKIAR